MQYICMLLMLIIAWKDLWAGIADCVIAVMTLRSGGQLFFIKSKRGYEASPPDMQSVGLQQDSGTACIGLHLL